MVDNFSNISDILDNSFFNTKDVQIALRHSAIFSFWGLISGKKFKNSSKPYAIKNSKMFVSCANSVVAQELSMYKTILLKKILPYCEPLDVKITDFVFEYKNWSSNTTISSDSDFPDFYTNDRLDCVNINVDDFKNVFLNIDNSPYLTECQKEKFKNRIIRLQKAKKLRFS